jgi:hypothetical protein
MCVWDDWGQNGMWIFFGATSLAQQGVGCCKLVRIKVEWGKISNIYKVVQIDIMVGSLGYQLSINQMVHT